MPNLQIDAVRKLLKESPVATEGATLADMRKGMDAMANMAPRLKEVSSEPVDAGGVPAEWFTFEDGDSGRVLLYVHGGGYVMGSVESHRCLLERLAVAVKGRVLALDYRLAPEVPFPAPVDDTLMAYKWLLETGSRPSQIAIAGDSAGGGLTLSALVAIRDAGLELPACGAPISPWTDMEGTGDSMQTRADVDPMVQKSAIIELGQTYLAGSDPRDPKASPLYADLNGLPPLLIQVGDCETLLDDTTRIEPRLKNAGVDVTVEVWDEMIHVWHLFAPMLDKGQEAITRIGEFVLEHTD